MLGLILGALKAAAKDVGEGVKNNIRGGGGGGGQPSSSPDGNFSYAPAPVNPGQMDAFAPQPASLPLANVQKPMGMRQPPPAAAVAPAPPVEDPNAPPKKRIGAFDNVAY